MLKFLVLSWLGSEISHQTSWEASNYLRKRNYKAEFFFFPLTKVKLWKVSSITLFIFLVREQAECNKSCNQIGSGSRRDFPIRPTLGRRNRQLLKNLMFQFCLLNDLYYYVSKNLSVKPLSSTWIITILITICSLEIVQFAANLATITALKCSGLSHTFRYVVEKNKNVIHQPRSVRLGKTVPSVLSTGVQDLLAQFFPIRTSQLVNNLFINCSLRTNDLSISHFFCAWS